MHGHASPPQAARNRRSNVIHLFEADRSWQIAQIADALGRSAALHANGLEILTDELFDDDSVSLSAERVAELEQIGATIRELADQIGALTELLPAQDLEITASAMRRGAARDLASGIFDPARLMLAARVLPVARGWPALSEGMRCTDGHASWEDLTLGELLGAFRDASPRLIAGVAQHASVSSSTELAECSRHDIRRIAVALAHYAARQP